MPLPPHPDLDTIDDPEILATLDRSRRVGTPAGVEHVVAG